MAKIERSEASLQFNLAKRERSEASLQFNLAKIELLTSIDSLHDIIYSSVFRFT